MNAGHNPEAAAWSEAGFDASMIGVRAAVERVLIDLVGVSRAGGDVQRSRLALFAYLRDADLRANAVQGVGDPPTLIAEPRPSGLPPRFLDRTKRHQTPYFGEAGRGPFS